MNNAQFRNLLNDNEKSKASKEVRGLAPTSLGSRGKVSMPMTPRAVAGHNSAKLFSQQVAEYKRDTDGQPALKKFKSAHAPKGTRLARGYEDRTSLRRQDDEEKSAKEKKLKELEDMMKSEKIDRDTFEKLRDQMGVGGDLGSTHLIKGLDRKLLERIRRGEDLNADSKKEDEPAQDAVDVDDELDTALDKDIAYTPTEEIKAAQSETTNAPSHTLSRDEILRRLKESRNAKVQQPLVPEPVLGERFKKVPAAEKSGKKKFVETIDGRRREVLIVTGKDGNTKRKTRWLDLEIAVTDKQAAPLGMEVPAEFLAKQKALLEKEAAEDEDDDIFAGVGADYDPLKDIDSESDGEADKPTEETEKVATNGEESKPRNYFGATAETDTKDDRINPLTRDPTLLAALKRAAALRPNEEREDGEGHEKVDPEQSERRKQFLAKLKQREREDALDLDLGFGESRFGDEDDEEGPTWDGEEERGGQRRKRGGKKRKGDKDSVADIMSVIDGRKKS